MEFIKDSNLIRLRSTNPSPSPFYKEPRDSGALCLFGQDCKIRISKKNFSYKVLA